MQGFVSEIDWETLKIGPNSALDPDQKADLKDQMTSGEAEMIYRHYCGGRYTTFACDVDDAILCLFRTQYLFSRIRKNVARKTKE